jgi:hypothetical protein
MNTSTKPTSNETECGNKSKPLLLVVIRQLTTRGFSLKDRDIKNDKRLGIHLSLKNETGKYIEIYDEKTYWHILHYGFDGKYLPIGFDVLFQKDISEYGKFLTTILANNQ